MCKRESGIDLLRCVAFLFVVGFHFFLFNGYYYEKQTGINMLLSNSIRYIFVSCNGLFMMLTGYLKCNEPLNKGYFKRIVSVLLGYFLASSISIPIRHFYLGDTQTLKTWIERLFSFGGVYYGWYVGMYIGLLLFSPIINLAVKNIDNSRELFVISGLMIIATALPGMTHYPFFPSYWIAAYPLTYYMLGVCIKKTKYKLSTGVGLLLALTAALIMGFATLCSTDEDIHNAEAWTFGDIWIVLIVFLIFISIYHIELPRIPAKIFKWAQGGCFYGYLMSHIFDASIYRYFPDWHNPSHYILMFVCCSLPIWILSIIIGKILGKIISVITNKL